MKHIWSVFCRNVLEDKNTGNPSLIEIVDRMSFKADLPDESPYSLPLPMSFFIVSKWWNHINDNKSIYDSRTRFLAPNGKELLNVEQKLDFENTAKLRTSGQIGSLPFTQNGIYEFEISYKDGNDWVPVASIPLEIVHEGSDESA